MNNETKEQESVETEDNGIVIDTVETDLARLEAGEAEPQESTEEQPDEVEPEKEEEVKEPTKKPSRAERRIKRQQDRIHELEEKLKVKGTTPETEKVETPEVDIDDFESYDDYLDAVKKSEEVETTPEKVEETTTQTLDNDKINDMLEDGIEEYDDFEELVNATDLALTQDVLSNVLESDNPSDLAYYLATHKDETREIAGMTAKQMERALIKIEVSLNGKPAKAVRTSKAPKPITPVNGASASGKTLNDDLSYEEHEALLNAQRKPDAGGFI